MIDERLSEPGLMIDVAAAAALESGSAEDPFALLGPHADATGVVIRAFVPPAEAVEVIGPDDELLARMLPIEPQGLYAGRIAATARYRLRIHWPGGVTQVTEDPYAFGLLLGELDVYLLAEGNHLELGRCLGAQTLSIEGVSGVRFAVWAPNARRVSVVGDFNDWDGRRHPMRLHPGAGLWDIFLPGVGHGALYKYEIRTRDGTVLLKAAPYAFAAERPPRTASVVQGLP